MKIKSPKEEASIRSTVHLKTEELQRSADLISFKEAVKQSKATQEEVDELAKESKKGWWANRVVALSVK